jgi:hypothetical protein
MNYRSLPGIVLVEGTGDRRAACAPAWPGRVKAFAVPKTTWSRATLHTCALPARKRSAVRGLSSR